MNTQVSNNKNFYDTLTGLPNRKKLEFDLQCDTLPIIVLVDIDKLSVINELYGLEVGNKAIKALSIFLKEFAKEHNYHLYRVTGDGFVLADCVEILDIFKYQKDLIQLFAKIRNFKFLHQKEAISVDITAGISMVQTQPLEKADIALNHAKKTKKDYIVYSNMLDDTEKKFNELQWKDKIKTSIDTNSIVSVYQGIVDRNKNIIKYEALMRVKDSDGKLITPFYFLNIAVDTKQYTQISAMLIRKTLKDALYCPKDISINLTYTDILHHQFMDEIENFIIDNQIGKKIIFEIVESEYIEDFELLDEFIKRFRKHGVRIAIDDFGSGFSNFAYILKIKPEYIKIDGSLIQKIEDDKESFILVEAIVNLAHKLGIKIICEFVSNQTIFSILKTLQVDEYQGYYLHKPEELVFNK